MNAISLKIYRHLLASGEKVKVLFSKKYLLYTNTAISLSMSCVGDGLQQNYQIVQKEMSCWDLRRSRDVAISGFLIGPFCHYWYIFLDSWLPGRSAKIITKKLIVDQFVCSPIVIGSFLIATSLLEGKRGQDFKSEVIEKGKILYKAEWYIWPPAQIFNFWLLPTKFRVLFDNVISFGFDWYFSYIKYGKCERTKSKNWEPSMIKESDFYEIEEFNNYISSLNFCGTGTHIPFVHIQAAEMIHLRNERKKHHSSGYSEMAGMGSKDYSGQHSLVKIVSLNESFNDEIVEVEEGKADREDQKCV